LNIIKKIKKRGEIMSKSRELNLYELPGFPAGLPEKDILVDHAREYFSRAAYCQGMVGLSWVGENKEGEKILYHDLFITYNKDDGLIRSDKEGKAFKLDEIVDSDQPLGKNTGIVHEKAMLQIKARIAKAIENKDKNLEIFKGMYSQTSTGEIILNKQKMFGWGIFKGDQDLLLFRVRNSSANINNKSIIFNKEYLYINFFEENNKNLIKHFSKDYSLRRCLPLPIVERIRNVLFSQLPTDSLNTKRACDDEMMDYDNFPCEKEWEIINNDPATKIIKLRKTLKQFGLLSETEYKRLYALYPETDHLKNIIELLIKNYAKYTNTDPTLKNIVNFTNAVGVSAKVTETIKKIMQLTTASVAASGLFSNKTDVLSHPVKIDYVLAEFKTIKDIKTTSIQKQKLLHCIDTFILRNIDFDALYEYDLLKQEKNLKIKNTKIVEKFFTMLNELNIAPYVFKMDSFTSQMEFLDKLIDLLENYTVGVSQRLAFSVPKY
jgi:hypothetical protein